MAKFAHAMGKPTKLEEEFAGLRGDLQWHVHQVEWELANKNPDRVRQLFTTISRSPADLDEAFNSLQTIFLAAGEGNFLLNLVIEGCPGTFSRLRLVEKTIILGSIAERREDVLAAFSSFESAPGEAVVSWSAVNRMAAAKSLGNNVLRRLLRLKYLGVSTRPERLLNSADSLADRIEVPQPLLKHLYAYTQYKTMKRKKWERHVRTAFAIDHLTKDFLGLADGNLERWLGPDSLRHIEEQVGAALANVDRSKGLVLTTFHGGFSRLTIVLFQHLFQDGVIVLGGIRGSKGSDAGRAIRVVGHERTALFQALRTVQSGKPVWIGADAPFGNSKQSIDILGVDKQVADGAPFLAFEARCPTMWMALVRDRSGFSVVTAIGPTRAPGEKYQAFKDRWFEFYRDRIVDFLKGDPRNLALRPFWMEVLGKSSEGTDAANDQAAPIRLTAGGSRSTRVSPDWI